LIKTCKPALEISYKQINWSTVLNKDKEDNINFHSRLKALWTWTKEFPTILLWINLKTQSWIAFQTIQISTWIPKFFKIRNLNYLS
jgi:hypothetical protein